MTKEAPSAQALIKTDIYRMSIEELDELKEHLKALLEQVDMERKHRSLSYQVIDDLRNKVRDCEALASILEEL
jgi:hypothetical protein